MVKSRNKTLERYGNMIMERLCGNKYKKETMLNRLICGITAIVLLFVCTCSGISYAKEEETVQASYTGMKNSQAVISLMNYPGISGLGEISRQALYEAGALDIMRSFEGSIINYDSVVTKEQAIAIALRMAGKEQKAREALQDYLESGGTMVSWSDGYILLAADEEMISQQDLADAFGQTAGGVLSFVRTAPVERQEFAYWIAKAMKLDTNYKGQKAYSSFTDRQSIDAEKIPFVESILANGIMGLDGTGSFNPEAGVTVEQAAYIVKSAEKYMLPYLGYTKLSGTVENISTTKDYTSGQELEMKTFSIRNINGQLYKLNVVRRPESAAYDISTLNQIQADEVVREIVVYKDGMIGNSDLLGIGDRIEYYSDSNNAIVFTKVISSIYDTKYIAAMIKDINTKDLVLSVDQLFNIETPDINEAIDYISNNSEIIATDALYRYAANLEVEANGNILGADALEPDTYAVLTVKNNIVVSAIVFDPEESFKKDNQEKGIVMGIVEDNNPYLGYITLYLPNGSGISQDNYLEMIRLRTYNYRNPNAVEVYKNHVRASIEEVEPGDSVYMKLDERGEVISISAVDNYMVKYAKVLSKSMNLLTVQYDDGKQQILDINGNIPVFKEKRMTDLSSVKDGDRVRLLLHITPQFTRIKEITIEGDEHFITNIYKGRISNVNTMLGSFTVYNAEVLKNGEWTRVEKNGILNIKLAEDSSLYFDNKKIDLSAAAKNYRDREAYFAVEKDYGGAERAVVVVYRNERDAEDYPYDDTVRSVAGGSQILLSRENRTVEITPSTIVVKDGRLVTGYSISPDDTAYVVANRSSANGSYYAGIVTIGDRINSNIYQIYRGRISAINPGKSFTVESFSTLGSTEWQYVNTPKTFNITFDTRILDDEGLINQRDFTGYGANSYLRQVVYIVAKDTDAVLVSTAPYGSVSAVGEVIDYVEGNAAGGGQTDTQSMLMLSSSKVFDTATRLWVNKGDMQISVLANTVVIKGDKIITPAELEKGDRIRVIKRDTSSAGDGYVIIVE